MARRGQQQAIVSAQDLPPLIKLPNGNFGYSTRFRIISEDGSRFSDWSNVTNVEVSKADFLPVGVASLKLEISVSDYTVTATWQDISRAGQYDVFVNWYNTADSWTGYYYHGTSSTHNYSFINVGPISDIGTQTLGYYEEVEVIIQVASINHELDTNIELAATDGPVSLL